MTADKSSARRQRAFRPLAGLLAASAVSLTGTRISSIALPWFVLVTTDSATRTGLVVFCEMVPYVAFRAFAGPLVDRTGARKVSWIADVASASAVSVVPLLHTLDLLSFWLLLVAVALIGTVRGPGDLAKKVMIPEAAERGRVALERAAGLSGVIERLASTVGPLLGGALLAWFGPLTGLVITAVCFALGSAIVRVTLPRGMMAGDERERSPGGQEGPGYWRRFGDGFAFLRGDRLLLTNVIMVSITNLLDTAFMMVFLPVWAKTSGHGPGVIGLTSSALGVASIAGSLVAAAVADRMRRRVVFFSGFLVAGAPKFFVLAADVPMWVVLTVFVVGGFGLGFLNPTLAAVAFERVPRPLLGRVSSLGDAMAWVGIPFGGLIAGVAVTSLGLVPALVASATVYFLTTNLAGLRPEWREMDRPRDRRRMSVPEDQAA